MVSSLSLPHLHLSIVAQVQTQAEFDSSSIPSTEMSHSDSAVENASKEHPPQDPQGETELSTASSQQQDPPHLTHVGDITDLSLEEVASRLVADSLSRAVQRCYMEEVGGRQVRRVPCVCVVCLMPAVDV